MKMPFGGGLVDSRPSNPGSIPLAVKKAGVGPSFKETKLRSGMRRSNAKIGGLVDPL